MSTNYIPPVVMAMAFILPDALLASPVPELSLMSEIAYAMLLVAGAGMTAWWARGWRERARARAMLDDLRRNGEVLPEDTGVGGVVGAARAALQHLSGALAEEREKSRTQAAVRQRIEDELRASEERYALALKGADEGW